MPPEPLDPLEVFRDFRDVMRIHCKQILKLDEHTTKVPTHTVALLVMIAYEALARYTTPPAPVERGDVEWLFAQRHYALYGIHESLGRCIFRTIRNGLAHTYGIYAIPVEGIGEVRLVMTWKDGAHAHLKRVGRGAGTVKKGLHPLARGSQDLSGVICVDVGSLWSDLDNLFTDIGRTLTESPDAAAQFGARMAENRAYFTGRLRERAPGYFDPELWRDFLSTRKLEEDA